MFIENNISRKKYEVGVQIKKFISFDSKRISKKNTLSSTRVKLSLIK